MELAYRLLSTVNGIVQVNPDGTVVSVQPDGSVETRPVGTIGPWEICKLVGPFLVYTPKTGETSFYFLPSTTRG